MCVCCSLMRFYDVKTDDVVTGVTVCEKLVKEIFPGVINA